MKVIQLQQQLNEFDSVAEGRPIWGGHAIDLFGLDPCGHDGKHDPDCQTCGINEGKEACRGCQGVNRKELEIEHVIDDTTTVLKPNGKPLLIYVKDSIPRNICEDAFRVVKQVPIEGAGDNRGLAAGIMVGHDDEKINRSHGSFGQLSGRGTRYHTLKQDGTMSRTTYAASVESAVVGYFDRYPRINYCRQTVFTQDNWDLWLELLPYIQKASDVFKEYAPGQWQKQKEFVDKINPDFKIHDSIFTTLTINRSWRTSLHTDQGDFRSGLGVMSVLQGGQYTGAELVFPKYKVAISMKTGGIALADVHELHGNCPIEGVPGEYVRMSCVFYAREAMIKCKSLEEELQMAKEFSDNIAKRHKTKLSLGKLF